MMGKFLLRTVLFFSLFIGVMWVLLRLFSFPVEQRNFQVDETESNLLTWENEPTSYDLLFMGISHARNFSRHHNHYHVEKILNASIMNIGLGGGFCGASEQEFYLRYFFAKGHNANKVVYFISPPVFFSERLALASNTFDKEPFEAAFFTRYLFFPAENKTERLTSYVQTKFSKDWLHHKPHSKKAMTDSLEKIDTAAVKQGQQLAYDNTFSLARFEYSAKRIERSVKAALEEGSEVILIIPPALFGKWKGHEHVKEFGERMQLQQGVFFYDHATVFLNPKWYYDHHHLNTKGVKQYTEHFLLPILTSP